MWKMLKKDNRMITSFILAVGFILAFIVIYMRVSSMFQPHISEPIYRKNFVNQIDAISYVELRRSMAQVRLRFPVLPDFSEEWIDRPQVIVTWRAEARSGEKLSGTTMGVLTPPYTSFIFSIQDDLEAELRKVHTEYRIINEYRWRIIREIELLAIELVHPETGEELGRFRQTYNPYERPPDYLRPDQ